MDTAEKETLGYRNPPLPLPRIKQVMKSDLEVPGLFLIRILNTIQAINLAICPRQ
ncbi:hypothetical protein C8R48DRAFT_695830 [Suillus tomentosus]|nr:hypothetical protein C8R48DRAFT_695830 [Suillus tomentosus]